MSPKPKAAARKNRPSNAKAPARQPSTTRTRSTKSSDIATLLAEIAELRTVIESTRAAERSSPSTSTDEIESIRRVLSDVIECRMESVLGQIVAIRNTAVAIESEEGRRVVEQLDKLLNDLGATRFTAEPLEHVDPLIHVVARETHNARMPDGVVAETVRPGFATGRGVILAKALVAVNRRP